MKNDDWNKTFMNIAFEIAKRSTCYKYKVGAVLVKDKRIISIGYNGVPSGQMHCEDFFYDTTSEMTIKNHSAWSRLNEIHAEMNAIAYAAKAGISTDEAVLYCTLSPCIDCAKIIVASGIKEVYFAGPCRDKKEDDGIEFLKNNLNLVVHMDQSNV